MSAAGLCADRGEDECGWLDGEVMQDTELLKHGESRNVLLDKK